MNNLGKRSGRYAVSFVCFVLFCFVFNMKTMIKSTFYKRQQNGKYRLHDGESGDHSQRLGATEMTTSCVTISPPTLEQKT